MDTSNIPNAFVSPDALAARMLAGDWGVPGEQPSRWITRERSKIDRIACRWLIRRFMDPQAEFFYVPTATVFSEAMAAWQGTPAESYNWKPETMAGTPA